MLSIIFWPFQLIWFVVGFVFHVLGWVASIVASLFLVILGIVLTCTILGAFMGIPLVLFGILLLLKSIF